MASRRQQSLVISVFIIALSLILIIIRLSSDLHSPTLFIIKVLFLPIALAFFSLIIGVAIYMRDRYIFIALSASLILILPFTLPNFSAKPNKNNTPDLISIVTFSTMTRTENHQDVAKFAHKERPDILCLQEVSGPHLVVLKNSIDSIYKYSVSNNHNLSIFSRYPITVDTDQKSYFSAIIDLPYFEATTIINAHMPRQYRQKTMTDDWKTLLSSLGSINTQHGILCGDLNLTPNNSVYDLITKHYGFDDALNYGYGFTYPNAQRKFAIFGPLIRIDYLLSKNLIPYNTRTLNISDLSDHRGVMTYYKKQ